MIKNLFNMFNSYEAFGNEDCVQTVETYSNEYNTNTNLIKTNLSYYSDLFNEYENMYHYLLQIQEENHSLSNKLKNTNTQIVTNDRKTFYEDQGISQLQFFYSIFYYIYIILVILFGVFFLLKLSSFTSSEKITNLIIFILLFCYPFVSSKLMETVLYIFKSFISIFPANAYKKL